MRGGPQAVLYRRTYQTANGIFQLVAGAFRGGLKQSYLSVRGLI